MSILQRDWHIGKKRFTHRFYRNQKKLLGSLLGLLVALGGCVSCWAAETSSTVADDFTLKTPTGENLRLKELRGQVVLLNFWASWCSPCQTELPLLDALHKKYEPLGFTVLGVNVDEDPGNADTVLAKIPVSFPVVFDTDNQVIEKYGAETMPSTYLIDRQGNIRYYHRGYQEGYEAIYESDAKKLLRE